MPAAVATQSEKKGVLEKKQPNTYSLLEYLKREEKSLHKHEFYNGQIVRMAGGSYNHNTISAQIISELVFAVKPLARSYNVCSSDMKIYIPESNHAVYPDAVVICEGPEFWGGRNDIILNPLVIVEVLSPSTEKYDKSMKFSEYKSIPSFKEYVLVRQDTYHIESWFREEEDLWRMRTVKDIGDALLLKSLGCSISLKGVYGNLKL